MSTVIDGIIIGGAGGAVAGITVYSVQYLHQKINDRIDSSAIYKWLSENTEDEQGNRFRSTRAISSWTNLTQDRVRYLCSRHNKIYLSTGQREDMWGVLQREGDGFVFS